MKIMRVSFIFFVFAALVCIPTLSYSEMKVTLTNGREIIADTCEDEGGQLVCTKMGGTFNIEKKDVRSVREVKGGGSEPFSSEPASPAPAEPEKKTDDAPGATRSDNKEKPAVGERAEAMKQLEEVTNKKKELSAEREKLVKEGEHIQEDLKKAPDWMPTKQYDELNARNEQLKEKIKLFNEEAGRLNEEEKQIVEGLKKKD